MKIILVVMMVVIDDDDDVGGDDDGDGDDDVVLSSGSKGWRTMDYIWNKSWVLLDRFDPVSDYEVRLLARNRLGDMSTSSILKFSNQRHGKAAVQWSLTRDTVRQRYSGLYPETR